MYFNSDNPLFWKRFVFQLNLISSPIICGTRTTAVKHRKRKLSGCIPTILRVEQTGIKNRGDKSRVSTERDFKLRVHIRNRSSIKSLRKCSLLPPKWKLRLYVPPSDKHIHAYYPPVKERGEDENTEDAEGQDVEDVGQEHLPFTVKTILTLLITDSSQCRDCRENRERECMT